MLSKFRLPLGERLYALAARRGGGWLGRQRDPIGPLVLIRGLRELLTVLSVLEHHRLLLEEVAQNRELIRKRTSQLLKGEDFIS